MTSTSLGGVRDDIITLLSLAYGGDETKARTKVDELEARIRGEAKKGAEGAIPHIRQEVRSEVQPYVIVALAVSGIGLLTAIGALWLSYKRS